MINIKKNGFTLVELIIVIGIVSAAAVLIGTNFMQLIGNAGDFEDKEVAKGIAEATYVYFDSKDNLNADGTYKKNCITGEMLINNGYIAPEQGLLKNYSEDDLKQFSAHAIIDDGEKKITVFKGSLNCTDNDKVIDYKD